jgi:hypothetical protein
MLRAGTIFFPGQYPHGFAYPAWLGSLSLLTGVPPYVANTIILPFLGVIGFTLAAYLAYRVVLQSESMAFWATIMLFAVPDLMFSVLRGNHEKMNIFMLLILVFVLFKSFQSTESRDGAAGTSRLPFVLLFYAFTFLNATANDYFASTLSVGLLLVTGWVLLASRMRREPSVFDHQAERLWLVTATSWLVIFWVMFFVFPEAGADFALIGQAWNKVWELFLSLQPASNPYSAAAAQWSNPTVAFLGESFRWVISVGSFLGWSVSIVRWLMNRRSLAFRQHFMLALYGGLGFLITLAIPVDFAGLAAGSNLELRNFTYFALVAAPMFIVTLAMVGSLVARIRLPRLAPGYARLLKLGMAFSLVGFVIISLMKVTLDPLVSNSFVVYSASENQAMQYFLNDAGPNAVLWGGPTSRLSLASASRLWPNPWRVVGGGLVVPGEKMSYMESPLTRLSAIVADAPLPRYAEMNQIYDNGQARLAQPPPVSPFQ